MERISWKEESVRMRFASRVPTMKVLTVHISRDYKAEVIQQEISWTEGKCDPKPHDRQWLNFQNSNQGTRAKVNLLVQRVSDDKTMLTSCIALSILLLICSAMYPGLHPNILDMGHIWLGSKHKKMRGRTCSAPALDILWKELIHDCMLPSLAT